MQKSPRNGAILTIAAASIFSMFALVACGSEVKVHVDCEGAAEGVNCKVHQTQGTAHVETCFDVTFTCKNGKKPHAHACEEVSDGKTETMLIPKNKVELWADCDKATGAEVTNMKITAK